MDARAKELLRSLRDQGPRTRSQLAETLGTSRATVNTVLAELAGSGWVQDTAAQVSSGGRPSAQVRLHEGRCVVAVSVGETRARVAVVHAGLTILRSSRLVLSGSSADEVVEWVSSSTRGLLADLEAEVRSPEEPALGLAVAPGAVDGLDRRHLEDVLGLGPAAHLEPVRAMARGEGHAGACRQDPDYLVVRLGSGVTTTSVSGRRFVMGANDAGGEIGHLRVDEFGPACTCGNSGCLDSFVGLGALLEQARAAGDAGRSAAFAEVLARDRALEIGDLVAAVSAGDRVAVQVVRDAGRRVGEVLAALVAFTNPSRVVLGGPVAALGDNLLAEVRAAIYRKAPATLTHDLRIDLSDLGERAMLIGAAHAATERALDT